LGVAAHIFTETGLRWSGRIDAAPRVIRPAVATSERTSDSGAFLRSAAASSWRHARSRSASFLFDILNIDEVSLRAPRRSILDGGLPYVDAVDIKPP